MDEKSVVVSQEDAQYIIDLEERTCLECYKVKLCHPLLAVCEQCFSAVWVPALPSLFKQKASNASS